MTHFRRWLYLGLTLLGTQLSAGCYLGYTNRPVLFPSIAYSPSYARPGVGVGCGPSCYREFGPSGCGGSLLGGPVGGYAGPVASGPAVTGPVYGGPVYDAPVTISAPPAGISYGGGYDLPIYSGGYSTPISGGGFSAPGCIGCAANAGVSGIPITTVSGIPIAGSVGGPPIAVSPAGGMTGGLTYGMPGGGPVQGVPFDSGMVPTLKPPPGSVPLQMPSEVKEAKKISVAGK